MDESRIFNFGAIHPDCENYKEIINDIVAMELKGIIRHFKVINYYKKYGVISQQCYFFINPKIRLAFSPNINLLSLSESPDC